MGAGQQDWQKGEGLMQTFCQWLVVLMLAGMWALSAKDATDDREFWYLVFATLATLFGAVVLYGAGAFSRIL